MLDKTTPTPFLRKTKGFCALMSRGEGFLNLSTTISLGRGCLGAVVVFIV